MTVNYKQQNKKQKNLYKNYDVMMLMLHNSKKKKIA